MCIKVVVWNLLHLRESWRCRKGPERLLHVGRFGSRQRFSLSRQSFLVLCRDSGFCVVKGFSMGRVFLGCDRGFPGRDSVVFIMVFYRDRGPPYVMTVFCFLS